MATLPTRSGLLSKVAKFVRHPNVDWRDLDNIGRAAEVPPEPALAHNRQTLKDMIERKRHEDAVRKQEFDQLRQLRRDAPMAKPEANEESSPLVSSADTTGQEDRTLTIRKIDEIEAQMSKQWWKAQSQPAQTGFPQLLDAEPADVLKERSDSFFASTQFVSNLIDFDDIPTLFDQGSSAPSLLRDEAPVSVIDWQRQPIDNKGFESSKLFASGMGNNLADPDLEEAAVRFANGDEAGAESVLLGALRSQPFLSAVAQAQAEALFDLYRSLGQQANFEREALNYAQQFGCSAPTWQRTVHMPGGPLPEALPVVAWRSPAQLDAQALAQLPRHLPQGSSLSLDWSGLAQIAESAAPDLAALMAAWSEQQGALHFEGEEVLESLLRAATPRGVRQTAQYWWTARLDLLRILQWQDDFEMAAFDYCITYETAPDPWCPAVCELRQSAQLDGPDDAWLTDLGSPHDAQPQAAPSPAAAPPGPAAAGPGPVSLTLAGELLGADAPGLALLEAASQQDGEPDGLISICCTDLIRVDFSAAGSILNWVAQAQAKGRQIEFRDVPPLAASFFNLIGINQHAHVITRTH
ncbi:STAS domain-containing protein [Rhodoferax sp.]|uniref:STAS domain-containing protein n=1 Tax=Rhodoferax sp. TaxID=50421 RepID=UPI0019DC0D6D|nr:STAS domain-containing protein [Rhodoferax sp.]MBE0474801.1 STAS domain-containing protein [Rhodoferax sp.]